MEQKYLNKLLVFQNSEFGEFGVLTIDGKEWFPATDSARMLGYVNPQKAVRMHCKGVTEMLTPTNGGEQMMRYISESDLYRLITHSKLPSAERFENWVFDEVLPSIRKHGAYMTPETLMAALSTPDVMIQILTALKDEQDRNAVLNRKVDLLSQHTLQWDNRAFINAAVRKFAQSLTPRFGDQFTYAWNLYKKELLYRHDINLKSRATKYLNRTGKSKLPATLDLLTDEETVPAASTIVALCHESGVDISDLIKNIDPIESASYVAEGKP